MKKKILITAGALFLAIFTLKAQDKDSKQKSVVAISLGAAVNYYYGPGDRNFGKYESERVNWQINGMLGIALTQDKNGHRTMIAGFGGAGFNNESTVKNILADQKYLSTATGQQSSNNFYQIEGGLLIGELFRISTGVGQQNFDNQSLVKSDGTVLLNKTSLKYNSTTVGFNINFPAVALLVNVNFASGKDYDKTVVTPSAGLMIRL